MAIQSNIMPAWLRRQKDMVHHTVTIHHEEHVPRVHRLCEPMYVHARISQGHIEPVDKRPDLVRNKNSNGPIDVGSKSTDET
jgi:hypothetical protein